MAEGGNNNDDFIDNLRNAGSTGESQYPDEFEVYFTDHRRTILGRDKRPLNRKMVNRNVPIWIIKRRRRGRFYRL